MGFIFQIRVVNAFRAGVDPRGGPLPPGARRFQEITKIAAMQQARRSVSAAAAAHPAPPVQQTPL